MKILFAVDLKEPVNVTRAVEDLAARLEAELLVVHVFSAAPASSIPLDPMSGFGDFSYVLYDPDVQENIEKAEQHEFDAFLVHRFTRPVKAALLHGDPAPTLLQEAEAQNVDMIVLGKRHHSRLERLLLGSVTRDVVEHASRPVLLMPIEKKEES
ncbi:MAG: universal stress protein [Bacteroidetes bacterium]|nr:MAG: universal stress protein [Bacteroidota bacterium]GIV57231.1 MAG: universal stress protein [Rhodothermaceae bacterium]